MPERRRDAGRTRERILLAAQKIFSERDYGQARVSDIAAAAGVNQALVMRYYGSKDRLFETALAALLDLNNLPEGRSRENFGADVVRRLTGEEGGPPDPLPMVLRAVSDPDARQIAQRLMGERIMVPLAAWLGGVDAQERAAEILLLCAGFYTYHQLLPLAPFEGGIAPSARSWLEQSLQALADDQVNGA